MKKHNIILFFLLLLHSVVLVACNFGDGQTTPTEETDTNNEETTTGETEAAKELNLLFASEPPSLHPQLATDTTSGAILMSVFEGLTSLKDGEVVMAAAEDVEVSDDLKTYTFKLRDAKWTNGDPVTADDFAYAWTWALTAENASEYASILYPIKGAQSYHEGTGSVDDLGIKVIDEKTLEVTLENPTPYFLELTAFKTYYPIHKATAEANPNWYTDAGDNFVTNGPYKLADWQHNASITLEKHEDYWDASNVAISKVNIAMVESEATQAQMFDAGEIDFLGAPYGNIGLDVIDRYKSEGILTIAPYAGLYMYKFNTKGEFTSNANIRKALTLAIDRAGLIANITKGEQQPGKALVPSAIKGFEEDMGYFEDNDIEGAKAYLEQGMAELGISDPSEIKLTLSYNTSESHATIAQFIQEGWRTNLGIEVELENAEWQVYLDQVSALDYDIARMGWIADYNDAYTFLEMYNSAENGNNDTGWENEEYTALLEKSNTEADPEKRLELMKQAEVIFMEEMPIAPIYYYTNLSVKKDYVSGIQADALGNIYLKYADINK